MKTKITLQIECGKGTCASSPGKFCHFLVLLMNSPNQTCAVFGSLQDKDGWIQRHKKCMQED